MRRFLIITLLVLSAQSVFSNDRPWEFKIELSKKNYLLGENIWLDVTITNISPDTQISAAIIAEKGPGFTFVVRDSLGESVDFTGYYSSAVYHPDVYLIEPGRELYRCFNLSWLYRSMAENPGSYSIKGIIDLPFESDCYFDDLLSNKLSFNIIEPAGECQEAYELSTTALEYDNRSDSAKLYHQALLDRYPETVYAAKSFHDLRRSEIVHINSRYGEPFDLVSYANLIKYANVILFPYPNSGNSEFRLRWILLRMQQYEKSIVDNFLRNVSKAAPSTRLARFADQRLFIRDRMPAIDECVSIPYKEDRWKLEIQMSKTEYFLHEGLWIDVSITNISDDTLMSDCNIVPAHLGFNLVITDSAGNILEYVGSMILFGIGNKTHLIAPGEEVYACFSLGWLYGMADRLGRFTVRAETRFEGAYNPYVFPNLTSNEHSFSVIELGGTEKEVWDLMEEARDFKRRGKTLLVANRYVEIYENNPNSIFAVDCYYLAWSTLRSQLWSTNSAALTRNRLEMNTDLVELFPVSQRTGSWLTGIVYDMQDDDKRAFLTQVAQNHPNTRAARFASQMLIRTFRKQVPK